MGQLKHGKLQHLKKIPSIDPANPHLSGTP
jgi:hypothetical protein